MTTDPIDLEALRAALAAGPTPGPWNVGRFGVIHAGEHHSYVNGTAQEQLISVHPLMRSSADDPDEERKITTAYIAACDPTTIGALVAELTTRRARDAEGEAENVVADTYHAIAYELRTEAGWSVLEHVQYARELMEKCVFALGHSGANADLNHPQRELWERLRGCLEGRAPNSDAALLPFQRSDDKGATP